MNEGAQGVRRWLEDDGPGLRERFGDFFPGSGEAFDRFDRALLKHTRTHPAEALAAVEKARRELERSLPPPQRARLVRLHAHALRSTGDASQAARRYADAWAQFRALRDPLELGRTAIGYVDALALAGRHREAVEVAAAGRRRLAGRDELALARLESNLAVLRYAQGQLDEAARAWLAAHRRFAREGQDFERAICAFNLGQVELWRGAPDAARARFEEAAAVYDDRGFAEMGATARAGLAGSELLRGEWEAGLARLEALHSELVGLGSGRVAASVQRQRAQWLQALGALPAAERAARGAWEQYRQLGLEAEAAHAAFLHARLLAGLGRDHDSAVQLERARERWSGRGAHRWARHRAEVELARAELGRGDAVAALARLRPTLRALDRNDPGGAAPGARALAARAWLEQGRPALAERLARRAHRDARRPPASLERPHMALVLARALAARGDRSGAWRWLRRAVDEAEEQQLSLADRALRDQSAQKRDPVFAGAVDLGLELGGPRAARFALDTLGRARSAGLVEDLLAQRPGLDPELRTTLARLRERLLEAGEDGEDDVRFRAVRGQLEQLQRRLSPDRHTRPALLDRVVRARRLEAWSGQLGRRHLLMFDRGAHGWRALHLEPGGRARAHPLPGLEGALRHDWMGLRMLLEAASSAPTAQRDEFLARTTGEAERAFDALRAAFWEPLGLSGHAGEVVLVPSGPLHSLPLEAIVESGPVAAPALRRLPHPALLRPRPRARSREALLLHGPGEATVQETRGVAALLGAAGYSPRRSDRGAALAGRHEPLGLLHIAAHGVFHRASWLLSGFRLRDGWLGLEHLAPERLRGALVYLGSCESGLAREMPGAELQGWLAAGLAAGAREMVLSLWKLDDTAALAFARSFYPDWAAGRAGAAAAAAARAHAREQHPHPFTWAPFVAVG